MRIVIRMRTIYETPDGTGFVDEQKAIAYETKYLFNQWLRRYWHNAEVTEQEFIELLFKDWNVEVKE